MSVKKRKKTLTKTPKSRIVSMLRLLWLRSPERAAALKRSGNSCEACGIKGSKAKGREVPLEVHHNYGVPNWAHIVDVIYRHLLCDPKDLTVLCKPCHEEEHRTA